MRESQISWVVPSRASVPGRDECDATISSYSVHTGRRLAFKQKGKEEVSEHTHPTILRTVPG